jgi:hypothetical protein
MPRKTHSARFKYGSRKTLASEVTETVARGVAQEASLGAKNRAVEVVTADGAVKALFINGKDVS